MDSLFFDRWESQFRTAFISLLSYLSLLAMLRIAGNRMLSQLNAFDLIITVELGSALEAVFINHDYFSFRLNARSIILGLGAGIPITVLIVFGSTGMAISCKSDIH